MGQPPTIQASHLFEMRDVSRARHIVRVTVGPERDPMILSLEAPPDYRKTSAGGASFAKMEAERLNQYRVDHYRDGQWRSVTLEPTKENYHGVQPLGKENLLLVRGRTMGAADENAHVYGPGGKILRSFHAGDGIADVQTTANSQIWLSYFDEGVFGDTPLGNSGLACLDSAGQVRFRFNDLAVTGKVPDIADCYALNVCSDQETWLYYYTDFPVVRIVDREVTEVWAKIGIEGAGAFAVAGRQILFAGGYNKRASLLCANLDDSSSVKELLPVNCDGNSLASFSAFGRGNRLYLTTDTSVFVVDLANEV